MAGATPSCVDTPTRLWHLVASVVQRTGVRAARPANPMWSARAGAVVVVAAAAAAAAAGIIPAAAGRVGTASLTFAHNGTLYTVLHPVSEDPACDPVRDTPPTWNAVGDYLAASPRLRSSPWTDCGNERFTLRAHWLFMSLAADPRRPHALLRSVSWASNATADRRQLTAYAARLSSWARTTCAACASPRVVLYPFGGADALTALSLLPAATTYLLVARQNAAARLPAMATVTDRQRLFALVWQLNLRHVAATSYLHTLSQRELSRAEPAAGVLSLLAAELRLLGVDIVSVDDAAPQFDGATSAVVIRGKRVRRPRRGAAATRGAAGTARRRGRQRGQAEDVTVVYVGGDLRNATLLASLHAWLAVDNQRPVATLLKDAHYMPHSPEFGALNALVLNVSDVVVQTDSGLPFHMLPPWGDVQLYGRFPQHLNANGTVRPSHGSVQQPQLVAAYRAAGPDSVPHLPVRLGYCHREWEWRGPEQWVDVSGALLCPLIVAQRQGRGVVER